MDLYKAIQELYAEKERLERVIASLEELQRTTVQLPELPSATKRRGRKSMSEDERKVVSQRMKEYWSSRKQEQTESPESPSAPASGSKS
jgi:hypothetical protein